MDKRPTQAEQEKTRREQRADAKTIKAYAPTLARATEHMRAQSLIRGHRRVGYDAGPRQQCLGALLLGAGFGIVGFSLVVAVNQGAYAAVKVVAHARQVLIG